MATQTVIGSGPAANVGGSFQLRNGSTNALVGSANAEETASGSTIYTAAFTDQPAGTYRLVFVNSSGVVRYVQWVTILLVTGTYIGYETPEVVVESLLGPGDDQVTIEILDDEVGVPDVSVWITSDSEGSSVVAGTSVTNDSGRVTFLLTAGTTYYLWASKVGKVSIQGRSFVAVAD